MSKNISKKFKTMEKVNFEPGKNMDNIEAKMAMLGIESVGDKVENLNKLTGGKIKFKVDNQDLFLRRDEQQQLISVEYVSLDINGYVKLPELSNYNIGDLFMKAIELREKENEERERKENRTLLRNQDFEGYLDRLERRRHLNISVKLPKSVKQIKEDDLRRARTWIRYINSLWIYESTEICGDGMHELPNEIKDKTFKMVMCDSSGKAKSIHNVMFE